MYPGYGFLSENPELARACAEAGITFVGPDADTLELTGNKARAVAAARAAGVLGARLLGTFPGRRRTGQGRRGDRVPGVREGGRGRRRAWDAPRGGSRDAARVRSRRRAREAASAFGDPTVFLEKAVVDPRHIEVQIRADGEGNVMHLFERDCSLTRHQKVIELAPGADLDPELRERICADAVRLAREIGYRNAGTVEFLLDRDGNHVFIEMNPRIPVSTPSPGVPLPGAAQLRTPPGALADLGLSQETLTLRGAALQCRIPTKAPARRGEAGRRAVGQPGAGESRRATLNRLLFPGPTRDFEAHRQAYGDTSVLDSKDFFYGLRPAKEYAVDLEPGVRLLIELQAVGEPDERGMRTVMSSLNGQLRPIQVRDAAAASDVPVTEKADRANPGHVAAPFAGVVTLSVAEGDQVAAGGTVATIEAMKMEAAITAPRSGRVQPARHQPCPAGGGRGSARRDRLKPEALSV
ncbi:hypothetical protein SGLAM104S_01183 [Streptomyces glaucescens]